MTSRRPMTHSYSGNGRYGSQNGDDVLSPRLDSRNYLSSVRPENRSTFCTVMSQLTEETQPCFETTIKSKAVSETCNVKFTCVVTALSRIFVGSFSVLMTAGLISSVIFIVQRYNWTQVESLQKEQKNKSYANILKVDVAKEK